MLERHYKGNKLIKVLKQQYFLVLGGRDILRFQNSLLNNHNVVRHNHILPTMILGHHFLRLSSSFPSQIKLRGDFSRSFLSSFLGYSHSVNSYSTSWLSDLFSSESESGLFPCSIPLSLSIIEILVRVTTSLMWYGCFQFEKRLRDDRFWCFYTAYLVIFGC